MEFSRNRSPAHDHRAKRKRGQRPAQRGRRARDGGLFPLCPAHVHGRERAESLAREVREFMGLAGHATYEDGELNYILAPQRLAAGDSVISGEKADIKPGNAMPLGAIEGSQ